MMTKTSMSYLVEKAGKAENIVIFGAGKSGIYVRKILNKYKIPITAFCDNSENLQGRDIGNISILAVADAVHKYPKAVFVVANLHNGEEMKAELQAKGIRDQNIVFFYLSMICDYYEQAEPYEYEEEIQERYYYQFHRKLDLKNPKTYNEKTTWDMLYNKEPIRTQLSDKYRVRDWVIEKIGEEYLNQLYGCWEKANDINFNELPEEYVLKLNHGSGCNIIVKDKSEINEREIIAKLEYWRHINFAYYSLELQYRKIKPLIICEKYLENLNGDLYDYKVYCFHGKPKYISFVRGRGEHTPSDVFFDTKWERQPFHYKFHKKIEEDIPKPVQLEKMLELSRILSKPFQYVRVDWYLLPMGEIIFGEMTFSSFAGAVPWEPIEYDEILGKLI